MSNPTIAGCGCARQCYCGATMAYRAQPDDTYKWADETGRSEFPDPTLPSPYEVLAELEAATLANPGSQVAAAYSDLAARVSLCMVRPYMHVHAPHDRAGCPGVGVVPWCCDMPMQLRPSGWSCRERCDPR